MVFIVEIPHEIFKSETDIETTYSSVYRIFCLSFFSWYYSLHSGRQH
ncbi:unnamed protein product [Amoebophrya sp. A25]|nr:unnamed protein product [Amoebophrya sp. A25]|eukprot:GSA25T00013920001.1